ncbi:hypothetical protein AB2B41_06210 [Marimonas sp. MJW-29]|uniref:Uncharacterized protein n=1 Tax=Sulfitobacter sediminis TaxID=3234186 RepID=A0ABV3RKS2_9RHOB
MTMALAGEKSFSWGSVAAFDALDCNMLASCDADVINPTLQLILHCLGKVKILASVTGKRISLILDVPTVGKIAPIVGYLPGTVLSSLLLALRVGYRSIGALALAVSVTLATVLLFKRFLQVMSPGGAVPAILINTPGTAVNALTTYDGYKSKRAPTHAGWLHAKELGMVLLSGILCLSGGSRPMNGKYTPPIPQGGVTTRSGPSLSRSSTSADISPCNPSPGAVLSVVRGGRLPLGRR